MTTETIEKTEQSTNLEVPKMYKVLIHNDDRTTMDFVIAVLTEIFHRTPEEATEIMLAVHHEDQGVAGAPYTREIAEEKVHETITAARRAGYPLVATFEPV